MLWFEFELVPLSNFVGPSEVCHGKRMVEKHSTSSSLQLVSMYLKNVIDIIGLAKYLLTCYIWVNIGCAIVLPCPPRIKTHFPELLKKKKKNIGAVNNVNLYPMLYFKIEAKL